MFFRIYPLDAAGRYQAPHEVECGGDKDALAKAAELGARLKHGFDVWQLERFVGHYRLDGQGAPERLADRTKDAPK